MVSHKRLCHRKKSRHLTSEGLIKETHKILCTNISHPKYDTSWEEYADIYRNDVRQPERCDKCSTDTDKICLGVELGVAARTLFLIRDIVFGVVSGVIVARKGTSELRICELPMHMTNTSQLLTHPEES